MSERRYSPEEAAAIFQRAAERQLATRTASENQLASVDGMTLSQLQEIGRDVGIQPDEIAHAAGNLDRLGKSYVRRFLGLPIGVGRTVPLERKLSNEEWEQLVVDLRVTFDARGRLTDEGGFRQWTNGNLQALLEPTKSGHQLRLKTLKSDAYMYLNMGVALVTFAVALGMLSGVREGLGWKAVVLAVTGTVVFALGAVRVPLWARTRARQMQEIADRWTSG